MIILFNENTPSFPWSFFCSQSFSQHKRLTANFCFPNFQMHNAQKIVIIICICGWNVFLPLHSLCVWPSEFATKFLPFNFSSWWLNHTQKQQQQYLHNNGFDSWILHSHFSTVIFMFGEERHAWCINWNWINLWLFHGWKVIFDAKRSWVGWSEKQTFVVFVYFVCLFQPQK